MLDSLRYIVALSHALIGTSPIHRLMDAFDSGEAAWFASEEALLTVLQPSQVARLLKARGVLNPDKLGGAYQQANIHILVYGQPDYPPLLAQVYDAPYLLYVKGNVSALHQRSLGVVGTRRFTPYGERATQTLIEQLKPYNPCIVSGLAFGIDTIAHQAALEHQLPTVAVFATGIDEVYPRSNKKLAERIIACGGAVVSEYPMGVASDTFMFPQRNRIIAGLSQGTLVVEGPIKSGALITARLALDENRPVMAVPGQIFSPAAYGCNHLIQQGAYVVQTGSDIAGFMGWPPTEGLLPEQVEQLPLAQPDWLSALPDTQRHVFLALSHDPIALDALQSKLHALSVTELQSALTMLELTGRVTALPGSRFCRV